MKTLASFNALFTTSFLALAVLAACSDSTKPSTATKAVDTAVTAPSAPSPSTQTPSAPPTPPAPTRPSDDQATAFIERWIADMKAGAASAPRALDGADVSINGHACGAKPACAKRATKTIQTALKLPKPTTSVHLLAPDRYQYELIGALEPWQTGHDDVTWVEWEAEFEDGAGSDYEEAEVMLGLKAQPNGTLAIVAAAVGLQEFPDFNH